MNHRKAMRLVWVLVLLLTLRLSGFRLAAQVVNSESAEQKVFTNPDGSFRIAFPKSFPVCAAGTVSECIHSYIPVCTDDAMVCVVYPPNAFEGTNFGAAGFEVARIANGAPFFINSADRCATPMPVVSAGQAQPYTDFLISAEHPSEVIGGVLFVHGLSGGVAMSHSASTDVYRAFHKGKCYELRVTLTQSTYEVYEPGTIEKFTVADQKKVEAEMSRILHSFRFLN